MIEKISKTLGATVLALSFAMAAPVSAFAYVPLNENTEEADNSTTNATSNNVAIAGNNTETAANSGGILNSIFKFRTPSNEPHPDDNKDGVNGNVRDEHGRLSQLSTNTHNPYNGQIRLAIDIGAEFAEYEGDNVTEAIYLKVTPGGVVKLPKVKAREGYYFIGWGQGGVPEEPTWDIFTETVKMSEDTTETKDGKLFALYATDSGDGYCTCGAYKKGIYTAEQVAKFKEDAAKYNEQNFGATSIITSTPVRIGIGVVLLAAMVWLVVSIARNAKKKQELASGAELDDEDATSDKTSFDDENAEITSTPEQEDHDLERSADE